jgi:hypothetical protein
MTFPSVGPMGMAFRLFIAWLRQLQSGFPYDASVAAAARIANRTRSGLRFGSR